MARETTSVKALFRAFGRRRIETLSARMERRKWLMEALWHLLTHGYVELLPDESGDRIRLEVTPSEWMRLANAAIEILDNNGPVESLYSSDVIIINDYRNERNRLPAPDNRFG